MTQLKPPTLVLGTNTFALHSTAQTYFSGRLGVTAWDALTTNDQSRALITASSKINFAVLDTLKLGTIGTPSDSLASATCEMALFIAADVTTVDNPTTGSNVKKVGAGTAAVEFFSPVDGTRFPEMVMRFLKEGGSLASGASGSLTIGGFASGTSTVSSFDDCDTLNRTIGFGG